MASEKSICMKTKFIFINRAEIADQFQSISCLPYKELFTDEVVFIITSALENVLTKVKKDIDEYTTIQIVGLPNKQQLKNLIGNGYVDCLAKQKELIYQVIQNIRSVISSALSTISKSLKIEILFCGIIIINKL